VTRQKRVSVRAVADARVVGEFCPSGRRVSSDDPASRGVAADATDERARKPPNAAP